MPSFKLVCEHRNPWDETLDVRNTTEFEYEQLSDVISAFEDFLRGCGYVFEGNLDIVEEQKEKGCGGGCSDCQCDEVNFDREAQESRVRWSHTVESLMNPPTFRANDENSGKCSVCGLPESVMKAHQCWEQRCPIHPKGQ